MVRLVKINKRPFWNIERLGAACIPLEQGGGGGRGCLCKPPTSGGEPVTQTCKTPRQLCVGGGAGSTQHNKYYCM